MYVCLYRTTLYLHIYIYVYTYITTYIKSLFTYILGSWDLFISHFICKYHEAPVAASFAQDAVSVVNFTPNLVLAKLSLLIFHTQYCSCFASTLSDSLWGCRCCEFHLERCQFTWVASWLSSIVWKLEIRTGSMFVGWMFVSREASIVTNTVIANTLVTQQSSLWLLRYNIQD